MQYKISLNGWKSVHGVINICRYVDLVGEQETWWNIIASSENRNWLRRPFKERAGDH